MGALSDITVVEFGQYIAVPLCGQMLADAGARVIKVEPPEGDPARGNGPLASGFSRMFINKNRGKYCVALNLRSAEGLTVARQLAAKADVVLANFRPGQAASLGLDYESLREGNPGLIYASNSGFGKEGAEAAQAGFDGVLQAYSGMLLRSPGDTDDLAYDAGLPFADFTAALTLTYGVLVALHHRDQTGEGQEVSTSLLGACVFLESHRIMDVGKMDCWKEEFRRELPAWKAAGRSWAEIGQEALAMSAVQPNSAYARVYRAKDGAVMIQCGGKPSQRRLLALLDIQDPWVEERAYPSLAVGKAESERVVREIGAKIGRETVRHWLDTFHSEGIPASEVHHPLEMLDNPQVRANAYLYEFENEALGKTVVVGPTARLEKTPLRPPFPPRSPAGDTTAVLAELGYSPEETADLAVKGAVRLVARFAP